MKTITVCNGHREEIKVNVDGDRVYVTRDCKEGNVGVGVPTVASVKIGAKVEKEFDNKTVSKEKSFTKVGPGVRRKLKTSAKNVFLTIHVGNKVVCESNEVEKNECFIIKKNGDLVHGRRDKGLNWIEKDTEIDHKPKYQQHYKAGEKCEICGYIEKENRATSYCEDCDHDSELMCDDCARQHQLIKATYGHNIKKEFKPKAITKSLKVYSKSTELLSYYQNKQHRRQMSYFNIVAGEGDKVYHLRMNEKGLFMQTKVGTSYKFINIVPTRDNELLFNNSSDIAYAKRDVETDANVDIPPLPEQRPHEGVVKNLQQALRPHEKSTVHGKVVKFSAV